MTAGWGRTCPTCRAVSGSPCSRRDAGDQDANSARERDTGERGRLGPSPAGSRPGGDARRSRSSPTSPRARVATLARCVGDGAVWAAMQRARAGSQPGGGRCSHTPPPRPRQHVGHVTTVPTSSTAPPAVTVASCPASVRPSLLEQWGEGVYRAADRIKHLVDVVAARWPRSLRRDGPVTSPEVDVRSVGPLKRFKRSWRKWCDSKPYRHLS